MTSIWTRFGISSEETPHLCDIGSINSFVVGLSGVGKSTLINTCLGKPVAKTGSGRAVTLLTRLYEDESKTFGVYDTRGIELGNSSVKFNQGIMKELNQINKLKISDRPSVIWFAISVPRVFESELELMRTLSHKLPVIPVITKAYLPDEATQKETADRKKLITDIRESTATGNVSEPILINAVDNTTEKIMGIKELLTESYQRAMAGVTHIVSTSITIRGHMGQEVRIESGVDSRSQHVTDPSQPVIFDLLTPNTHYKIKINGNAVSTIRTVNA
jgi:GTPase Era involved in 16S rRNA processing